MVVIFQCNDPYIASRNREETCIAFEGTRKECEQFLLREFEDQESRIFGRVCDAVRCSNRRGNFDGLFRNQYGKKDLYLRYDSRSWEIMTKKEAVETYGFVTMTTRRR